VPRLADTAWRQGGASMVPICAVLAGWRKTLWVPCHTSKVWQVALHLCDFIAVAEKGDLPSLPKSGSFLRREPWEWHP
jgi:hypothetical protein